MGAKDWMLMYADRDIRPVLRSAPPIDRDATVALVERLHPGRRVSCMGDGTLFEHANPPGHHVYAGCFADLTIVCSGEVALDRPSTLDRRFLEEAAGRTVYLHAMHSVVGWFAYAVWDGAGVLRRSLSVSPDDGIMEHFGTPMEFEEPYWAGEHPFSVDENDDLPPHPVLFNPLDLAEDALRFLFGFNYEGVHHDDDPGLGDIVLMGFVIGPHSTH
ncbi:DUF6928 family protein [Actinoallomurus rhizosphaericola]|uniref:DUF6928 family protein n=1 Tax=Actinoallomurus rhizosphaericola TaxID=2952536 RepID=UPI00209267C2|nr:hypothetical protein [Actinoallomurus rhizosphaericola]MCO5995309.1 hypothetical protein [Actinoallomurus rhizosphaericola]